MSDCREMTREEFLEATGGPPHDDESHHSWGAVCRWHRNGKVYEEHQPDIGKCQWLEVDTTQGDKTDG